MKNQKSLFIYIAAYLAILIPTPGRFVFGVVIMTELILLTLVGILVNSLISVMKLNELRTIILLIVLISFTILFRQVLAALYPEIALVLGFILYLPSVSLFLIGYVFDEMEQSLGQRLKTNMFSILFFFISGLLFFLLRDITAYGTITFFGKNHQIFEKVLFSSETIGIFSFFASIPGAFFLAGFILFIHICIRNKLGIIKNSEVQNDIY